MKKTDFTPIKTQDLNFRKLKNHIARNGNKIKPAVGLGTIYAGKFMPWDLASKTEVILPIGNKNELMRELEGVWAVVGRINNYHIKKNGKIRFDTIEHVLTNISAPILTYPDTGEPTKFSNLWICAMQMTNLDKRKAQVTPIVTEANRRKVWKQLSGTYVYNAEGDLNVLEGLSDNHTALGKDKDFIAVELAKALKNPNFTDDTKKKIIALVKKYQKIIPDSQHSLAKELDDARSSLKKEAKNASKLQ